MTPLNCKKMDGDDLLTRMYDKLFEHDKPSSVITQVKPYALFYRWFGTSFPIRFSNSIAKDSFFFLVWPCLLFGTFYSQLVNDKDVFLYDTSSKVLFPIITSLVCMISSKNFVPMIENIQR